MKGYNSHKKRLYARRSVAIGGQEVYRFGDTFCPDAGWLLVWESSRARELTISLQGAVAGAGDISPQIVESAVVGRHGLIAVPWPVVNVTIDGGAALTNFSIHGYGIDSEATLAGWPNRLYAQTIENIAANATTTTDVPIGATRWCVGSKEGFIAAQVDKGGAIWDQYETVTGQITVGLPPPMAWRACLENGEIEVTNQGANAEDFSVWFEFDLSVGSGLG
tara:strand:+ start:569 stop:1231 length:663 start_codon:yes stop_codon:yes gene_type:complete